VTAPALVIRLELERRPQVREEAMSEGEATRLADWIKSHESLRQLVEDALLLATKRAA